MQERRKTSRWQVNKPASIKIEGALSFAECLIKDISFKGLRLSLPFRLTVDSYIKFNLKLSQDYSLKAEAWVAWQRYADGRNIYGLLFTAITDLDKENIYKFVYHSVPDEICKSLHREALKEGGEDMDDRRIFQRFSIRFPVKLLDLSSGKEALAETSDISAKGIGVWSGEDFAANTPMEAWLKIPDKGEPLYTRGTVVWSRPDPQGEYRLGIDLERADLMGLSRILRA